MKATALKAYLQKNNIKPSLLAKECQINEGYLSKLLNGRRSNPRFSVFARLAAEIGISALELKKLLQISYDSFVIENIPEVVSKQTSQDHFYNYLQRVLIASDQSEILRVTDLTEIIR